MTGEPASYAVQRQTEVYSRIPTINKPPRRQTMLRAASRSEEWRSSNSAGGKSVCVLDGPLGPCPIAAAPVIKIFLFPNRTWKKIAKNRPKTRVLEMAKSADFFQFSSLDFPITLYLYYCLPYLWQGFSTRQVANCKISLQDVPQS